MIDLGGQSISAHDHLDGVTPIPTLIVWGSRDRMIPAWHALSAQRAVPDCRVELFEGAGHFPHLDDPDRFARVLREFIADSSEAGPSDRDRGLTGSPRPAAAVPRTEDLGHWSAPRPWPKVANMWSAMSLSSAGTRPGGPWFSRRPGLTLLVIGVLFAAVLALRLLAGGPVDAYSMLYVLPVALAATALGMRGGAAAGVLAVALVLVWTVVRDVELGPSGWLTRAVPLLLLGFLLGRARDRARRAEVDLRRHEVAAMLHREAIEINDSLVQRMTAAKWSLESGLTEAGLDILTTAVSEAHQLVSDLLRRADMGERAEALPGGFGTGVGLEDGVGPGVGVGLRDGAWDSPEPDLSRRVRARARDSTSRSEQKPVRRRLRHISPSSVPSSSTTASRRSPRAARIAGTASAGAVAGTVRSRRVDQGSAGPLPGTCGGRSVRVRVPTSVLPSVSSTRCTWSLARAARASSTRAPAGKRLRAPEHDVAHQRIRVPPGVCSPATARALPAGASWSLTGRCGPSRGGAGGCRAGRRRGCGRRCRAG